MKILCVGRGYIGGALDKVTDFCTVSHQEFLDNPDCLWEFNTVVNTSGIIGQRKCDEAGYDAVIKANVEFPLFIQAEALKRGKSFIQLSTVGVCEKQVAPSISRYDAEPPFLMDEYCFVFPHNLYCSSKILNEQTVSQRKHIIFRLPWVLVKGVFASRICNWDSIQDTWCSVLRIETLADKIRHATQYPLIGTFNIADEHVYFPEFISNLLGKHLPIRTDYPEDMTAAIPIDTEKEKKSLLGNSPSNPDQEIASAGNF